MRDERETAELREQFIAVLGHDLRTPLSSIAMGTELLKRLSTEPGTRPVLERLEDSTRRISGLIDDVMDFTRGRMGSGIPLSPRQTNDLAERLRHVVAELQSTHRDRTIHSDISFEGTLLCDPVRIAQLLSNLLNNALVHGDARHPVRVTSDYTHGVLRLAVANRGTAIPAATLSRLFQPFWRGEGNSAGGGLGLGLYIASEIARSHSGTLDVTSTAEATTFTFNARL